jgi:tetratricopeptide (TPR) repeat protein
MIDNNNNINNPNPLDPIVRPASPTPKENYFTPRNIAIGVVILLVLGALAVLGFKYYKANQEVEEDLVEDTGVLPTAGDTTGNVNSTTNPVVPTTPKPEMSTESKKKFNTLLANGAKAFTSKNYAEALKNYNEALTLSDSDVVYIRLHSVYSAQGNNTKALEMLNIAISKNPAYTDYWNTKLTFLDEKTDSSFADLQAVYQEGLTKVDSRTKINLVTHFARIAESAGNYAEAISIFEYAKTVYPQNAKVYQAEIDRLTSTTK